MYDTISIKGLLENLKDLQKLFFKWPKCIQTSHRKSRRGLNVACDFKQLFCNSEHLCQIGRRIC